MRSNIFVNILHSVRCLPVMIAALSFGFTEAAWSKNELFSLPPVVSVGATVSADKVMPDAAPANFVKRSRRVGINASTLAHMLAKPSGANPAADATNGQMHTINLNLFADLSLDVVSDRIEQRSGNMISWRGKVVGDPTSLVLLVINNGVITGQVNTNGKSYAIRTGAGKLHDAIEWDTRAMPKDGHKFPSGAAIYSPSAAAALPILTPDAAISAAPTVETIDIAIVYTNQVKAAGGDIAAEAQLAIDQTNTVFQNSGIAAQVRLVYLAPINHNESTYIFQELSQLVNPDDGFLDQAPQIRQNAKADILTMWTQTGIDFCGYAGGILGNYSNGYNVMIRGCATSNYIFAHELGHNLGARHDMAVDSELTPFAYGHGAISPTGRWRSIMSYPDACSGPCPVVAYYSTPLRSMFGEPLGDAAWRDNSRVLNETRATVAKFDVDLANRVPYSSVRIVDSNGATVGALSKSGYEYWSGNLHLLAGTQALSIAADGDKFGGDGSFSSSLPNNGAAYKNGAPIYVSIPQVGDYEFRFNPTVGMYSLSTPGFYYNTWPTVYLRGTNNAWGKTPMTMIANYTWRTQVTFGTAANQRFKLDIYGDWKLNFGDTDKNGIVEQSGGDILIPSAGTYRITFHDQTRNYDIEKITGNVAPIANAGVDQTVAVGATVTFNGAGSSDADGVLVAANYVWTATGMPTLTGVNPRQVFAAAGTYTYTLTVTDANGAKATDQVVIKVNASGFTKLYPQVYLRGTNNAFAANAKMVLVANYTWQIDATFGSTTTERFKFDIYGDWTLNFGNNNTDNIADKGGADIKITKGAGTYRITFNDQTKVYSVVKL